MPGKACFSLPLPVRVLLFSVDSVTIHQSTNEINMERFKKYFFETVVPFLLWLLIIIFAFVLEYSGIKDGDKKEKKDKTPLSTSTCK